MATTTSSYTLPEGYFYVDEAAAKQYADNTGKEIVMPQKVNASVGGALDAWVQRIWLTGSGAKEVTPGTGRAYVGHTRLVPQLGIEEQIRTAGLPTENDAPGAVASVLYKVTKPGAMPIDDHVALVRFLRVSDTETEIVWTIKLTPSAEGSAVFPESASVVPFLFKAVTNALAVLAKDIDAAGAAP